MMQPGPHNFIGAIKMGIAVGVALAAFKLALIAF